MSAKVIKGAMSITRSNHDKINIRAECSTSHTHFIDIELSLEEFAFLVTGCHMDNLKMEVNNLERVGKTRVREERQVLLDYNDYRISQFDKEAMSRWLAYHCREEGYIVNTYLGSQGSVKYVDNGALLNYSVMKFVDGDN